MDPTSDLLPHDLLRILKANNAADDTSVKDIMDMSQRLATSPEGTAMLIEIAANATALCLTLSTEIGSLHSYMSDVMENLESLLFDYDIQPEETRNKVGSVFTDTPASINMLP